MAQHCSCFLLFACPKRTHSSELHLPLPVISCSGLLLLLCQMLQVLRNKGESTHMVLSDHKTNSQYQKPKRTCLFFVFLSSLENLLGNLQSYIQVPRPMERFIANVFYKVPSFLEIGPLGFPFMILLIPSIQNLRCTFPGIPK